MEDKNVPGLAAYRSSKPAPTTFWHLVGLPPVREDARQHPAGSQDIDDGDSSESESAVADTPPEPRVSGISLSRAGAGREEDDDEFELVDSGEGASAAALGKRKAAVPPRQQPKHPKGPSQPAATTGAYLHQRTLTAEAKKKKEEKKEEAKEGANATSVQMPPPSSHGPSPASLPKRGRRLALKSQLFSNEAGTDAAIDVDELDSPVGSPRAGGAEDAARASIAPSPPPAQPPSKKDDAAKAASSGTIVPGATSSPTTLLVTDATPVASVPASRPAAEGAGQPSFVNSMKLAAAAHQRELDDLQSQLAEARRSLLSCESVQADIDKLNVAHCNALKERETAVSAVRADLEKATARVADLKKVLKKSSADEIKALKEENSQVKSEMTDLTKHLRAAVRGLIGSSEDFVTLVPDALLDRVIVFSDRVVEVGAAILKHMSARVCNVPTQAADMVESLTQIPAIGDRWRRSAARSGAIVALGATVARYPKADFR